MLVYDLANPRELVAEARGTVFGLDASRFTLNRWLPRQQDVTLEYRISQVGNELRAATYRAFDTESVIGRRPGVTRVSGALAPISRKIPVTEYERLQLEQLGRQNEDRDIIAAHFNDTRRMSTAVAARLEMARGEALSTGKVQINEQNLQLTVDFGVPAEHRVAAATAWTDLANSDPLTDELGWLDVYQPSNNGRMPGVALTSRRVVGLLQRNTKLRNMYFNVGGGSPALLSIDQINATRAAYLLPPFVIYEEQITNDAGTTARVIANNLVLYLPDPGASEEDRIGETLEGVTAEALELRGEGWLETTEEIPGIVAVMHKTSSPVTRWTEAVTVALPLLRQPQRVLIANVG